MSDQDKTNYLEDLVGEGKKYNSVEELAKGTAHANEFIETLKNEKAALEAKLNETTAKEDKLDMIMEQLKPKPLFEPETEVKEPEPVPPKVEEPPKETTPTVPIEAQMKMNEFAKLAVDKFGSAQSAGEKLKEYIGDDPSRQGLVTSLMQTDPAALVKILPQPETQKVMSTTPSAQTTQSSTVTNLPVTGTQAMEMFTKDRQKYQSLAFQKQLYAAIAQCKEAGVDFYST